MTVHERLEEIMRNLFNDDDIVLTDDTTAADIPGWDSLAHVNLIFSVEKEFGTQFEDNEFTQFTNVGDLKRELARKGLG